MPSKSMPSGKPITVRSRSDVKAYLAALPADKRATLQSLRRMIKAAAPEATEGISYGMPYYKYKGKSLIGIAAFADHCSLFPTPGAIEALASELEGYTLSKGTIRFPVGKPPPAALVRRLVQARIAEIERSIQGSKARRSRP